MHDHELEIRDLAVNRSGRPVIRDAGLRVPGGELTGLVGPNGSGKSTLLSAIAGVLPSTGTILLDGAPVKREMLSFLPQSHTVGTQLTALEILLLGSHEKLGWRVPDTALDMADDVISRFGIADLASRKMNSLSGGQQQIVLLAQRLMRSPRLVLLDEPTSALDLHHQLSVIGILRDYAASTPAVVLASIHDLSLASRQCGWIVLIDGGEVRGCDKPDEVLADVNIRSVYNVETDIYRNPEGQALSVAVAASGHAARPA